MLGYINPFDQHLDFQSIKGKEGVFQFIFILARVFISFITRWKFDNTIA